MSLKVKQGAFEAVVLMGGGEGGSQVNLWTRQESYL
jgi:hypothetical protein